MRPFTPPSQLNRGVAVVLALVILVGLLLLGLPLLYSMTMARSGTASFKAQVTAHESLQSAEDLALGLGQIATTTHMGDRTRRHSCLDEDLLPTVSATCDFLLPNRFDLDLPAASLSDLSGGGSGKARIGLTMEDEGGKIDVNDMTKEMWDSLASALQLSLPSAKLANYRFFKGTFGREKDFFIRSLDELLVEAPSVTQNTNRSRTPTQPLLSKDKLERLRPFITAHGRGQGRDRMLDIGSLISTQKTVVLVLRDGESNLFPIPPDPPNSASVAKYLAATYDGGRRQIIGKRQDGSWPTMEFRWSTDNLGHDAQAWWMDENGGTCPPGVISFPSGHAARTGEPGDRTECLFDAPVSDLLGPGCVLVLTKLDLTPPETIRLRLIQRSNPQNAYRFWNHSITIKQFNVDYLADPNNISDHLFNGFISGSASRAAALEVSHAVNINHAPDLVCSVLGLSRNPLLTERPPLSATDPIQIGSTPANWDTSFKRLSPLSVIVDGNGLEISRSSTAPIDLRSWGVFRFQARSTAGDVRDRPLLSRMVTGIVQAAPATSSAFIHTIDRQADWEVLRRKGQLGRMATGPIATLRYKLDSAGSEPGCWSLGNLDQPGLGHTLPAPIDTWYASTRDQWVFPPNASLSNPSLLLPFRTPTATQGAIGQSQGLGGNQTPLTGILQVQELAPDGVTFSSGLRYDRTTVLPAVTVANNLLEAKGRQIAFWIKPRTAWNSSSSSIALLEMTAPAALCHPQISGAAGDPAFQNRLRLDFDNGFLIWTIAGPTIEHTNDQSRLGETLHAPQDDPSTLYTNEESLGKQAGNVPLTATQPWNLAKFAYYVGELKADQWYHIQAGIAHDRPGGQFISVDGLIGRGFEALPESGEPQPGDHCILPSVRLKTDLSGDYTVPTTKLDPQRADYNNRLSGSGLEFSLTCVHKKLGYTTADQILPKRGQIRIGNEFISYENLAGDTTGNYLRARRANTDVDSVTTAKTYSIMESHIGMLPGNSSGGSMVYPAGYRYKPGGGTLLRGKTTTTQNFLNGDPNPPVEYNATIGVLACKGRVWGRITNTVTGHPGHVIRKNLDGADGGRHHETDTDCVARLHPQKCVPHYVINYEAFDHVYMKANGSTVTVTIHPIDRLCIETDDTPYRQAWFPSTTATGIVRLQTRNAGTNPEAGTNQYWYYRHSHSATRGFTGLTAVHSALNRPNIGRIEFSVSSTTEAPIAWSISLPTQVGIDITDEAVFKAPDKFLQIESSDPNNRRIEWIKYKEAKALPGITDEYFFLDYDGWPRSQRGRERTIYAGETVTNLPGSGTDNNDGCDSSTLIFGPGSIILPVQTRLPQSHMLATGDVVTLIDDTAQSASQMAIRFAATDGYRNGITATSLPPAPGVSADVKNEYFTFTDKIPEYLTTAATTMTILHGRGWSGLDLNPLGSVALQRGCMPLPGRSDQSAVTLFGGNSGAGCNAWFDSVLVTQQPGDLVGSDKIGQMTHVLRRSGGVWQESFVLGSNDLGCLINVDAYPCVSQFRGLLKIGGEVIAYDQDELLKNDSAGINTREPGPWKPWPMSSTFPYPRNSGTWVRVIGRGLLGSTRLDHSITVASGDRRSGPPVMPLPFGPVEYMPQRLHRTYSDPFDVTPTLGAHPAILAVWPLGESTPVELLYCTGYHITPWMRGLYGSAIEDWSQTNQSITGADWGDINVTQKGLRPLLIGWWPRWPSALPQNFSTRWTNTDVQSGALRDRTYMSCAFPLRMDQMKGLIGSFDRTLGPANGFELQGRILGRGHLWHEAICATPRCDALTTPMTGAPFDGMEYKILWHYTDEATADFLSLIERLNRTPPGLVHVQLETKAPCIRYEHSDAR